MLRSMTVGKKIAMGFALVLVLTVAVGYLGYRGLNQTAEIADIARDSSAMHELALECRRREKDFMLREDLKYQERARRILWWSTERLGLL